jgi:SAM-dependent methyltransferase
MMSEKEHYFNPEYMRRERLLAYIDQISAILKYTQQADSILEVGKGNGYLYHFISTYLKLNVKSLDIASDLQPDFCGDISSEDLSLPDKFDIGLCFEVLEHLPLTQVPVALANLKKYVRKYIILSVPDTNFFIQMKMNILWLLYTPLSLTFSFARFMANRKMLGSDHQWEIGIRQGNQRVTKKYLLKYVLSDFEVLEGFRGREFPGHHFFIFRGSDT